MTILAIGMEGLTELFDESTHDMWRLSYHWASKPQPFITSRCLYVATWGTLLSAKKIMTFISFVCKDTTFALGVGHKYTTLMICIVELGDVIDAREKRRLTSGMSKLVMRVLVRIWFMRL